MIKVTFAGKSYECDRAVKGVNYIRLYDENNVLIISFEGVTDLAQFTINGGEWEVGKSSSVVTGQATTSDGSLMVSVPYTTPIESGLTINFIAPASSADVIDFIINGKSYDLVDSVGHSVLGISHIFNEHAAVCIIINSDNKTAYLQSGNYQKPWDIDENVGIISKDCDSLQVQMGDSILTKSLDIPMINSGTIKMSYTIGHNISKGSFDSNNSFIAVYINDSLQEKSLINFSYNKEFDKELTLTVKKGDILRLVATLSPTSIDISNYYIYAKSTRLLANIETPYKYLSLNNIKDISTHEILNALLGV